MNRFRNFVLGHLILGPLGNYIMAEDMQHPERWDIWYRDPYLAIPFLLAAEAFMVGCLVYVWLQDRKAEGMRLLQEARWLQDEGQHEAAEKAYQEATRLLGRWIKDGRAR